MSKKLGIWGKSLAIRLDSECKDLNWNEKDRIHVYIKDGKIILEKINEEFKVINGAKFIVKS